MPRRLFSGKCEMMDYELANAYVFDESGLIDQEILVQLPGQGDDKHTPEKKCTCKCRNAQKVNQQAPVLQKQVSFCAQKAPPKAKP